MAAQEEDGEDNVSIWDSASKDEEEVEAKQIDGAIPISKKYDGSQHTKSKDHLEHAIFLQSTHWMQGAHRSLWKKVY